MPSASCSLHIARPPAEVYAALADRRARMRLLPDNFAGARLATNAEAEAADAPGTRFAFTLHTDRGAYESVTELLSTDPSRTLVERTTDGEGNTYDTAWAVRGDGDGTLVTVETRYRVTGGVTGILLDRMFGRKAVGQGLLIELTKLKLRLEESSLAG